MLKNVEIRVLPHRRTDTGLYTRACTRHSTAHTGKGRHTRGGRTLIELDAHHSGELRSYVSVYVMLFSGFSRKSTNLERKFAQGDSGAVGRPGCHPIWIVGHCGSKYTRRSIAVRRISWYTGL